MLEIIESYDDRTIAAARVLIKEYAEFLGFDLNFQDFAEEMEHFPGTYAPPDGCLLLARESDETAGCVALHKINDQICEMKRLFVRPTFRGRAIGRRLVERIIEKARRMGYRTMRLDTVPQLESANRLYEKEGFKDIEPYYHNPIEGARFMELEL